MIKQIKQNKANGQKLVYIDKDSELQVGDYVRIDKVEEWKEDLSKDKDCIYTANVYNMNQLI